MIRSKAVTHKTTLRLKKGAELTFTPPLRHGGQVVDAKLVCRGREAQFPPISETLLRSSVLAKMNEIDVAIERDRLDAWNAAARAIISDIQKPAAKKKKVR